jgi:hypothetical protein
MIFYIQCIHVNAVTTRSKRRFDEQESPKRSRTDPPEPEPQARLHQLTARPPNPWHYTSQAHSLYLRFIELHFLQQIPKSLKNSEGYTQIFVVNILNQKGNSIYNLVLLNAHTRNSRNKLKPCLRRHINIGTLQENVLLFPTTLRSRN